MNSKNIKKVLDAKISHWIKSIEDKEIKKVIKDNVMITGGAIVSLLNNEEVNDYDVYFKTKEACIKISTYYANKFNETHKNKVEIKVDGDRVKCFIQSSGIAEEDNNEVSGITDKTEPNVKEDKINEESTSYSPIFFSTNAITLSNGIQFIIRFYGEAEEIHKNFDFVHCLCCYTYKEDELDLPARTLETIINKELVYMGSRYPVCSVIRTRKFIRRGYTINAGQYLKMCLQISELNLMDLDVFEDQLAGVDSAYFSEAVEQIKKRKEKEPNFDVDNKYLFEVINRIF